MPERFLFAVMRMGFVPIVSLFESIYWEKWSNWRPIYDHEPLFYVLPLTKKQCYEYIMTHNNVQKTRFFLLATLSGCFFDNNEWATISGNTEKYQSYKKSQLCWDFTDFFDLFEFLHLTICDGWFELSSYLSFFMSLVCFFFPFSDNCFI